MTRWSSSCWRPVAGHLLGEPGPDHQLLPYLTEAHPYAGPLADRLARALGSAVALFHLREATPGLGASLAAAALAQAGFGAVCLDLDRAGDHPDPAALLQYACREALLTGAGLIAGPVEALGGPRRRSCVQSPRRAFLYC